MFFDFNYDYNPSFSFKPVADVSIRVQAAIAHTIELPARVLELIANIVKVALSALVCALSFGQATGLNNYFLSNGKNFCMSICYVGVAAIGFFAPLNAREWNDELVRMRFTWV